jgi:hypothetical protein
MASSVLVRMAVKRGDFRKYVLDEVWRGFAKAIGGEYHLKRVEECCTTAKEYRCNDGCGLRTWKPMHCWDAYCPRCAKLTRLQEAGDEMEKVKQFYLCAGKLPVWIPWEVTLPRNMRVTLAFDRLIDLKKTADAVFVKVFKRHVERKRGLKDVTVMGESVVQWWHSSNPFLGSFPHVHGNVYSIIRDNEKGEYVYLREDEMYLQEDELADFRREWREAIKVFGNTKAKDVDVHVHVSRGYGRLAHRLEYMYRPASVDFYKYVKSARFYEKVVAEPDVAWVTRCIVLPKGFKAVSTFGLLAGSRYRKVIADLGGFIEKKAVRVRMKTRVNCPNCGCFMEPTGRRSRLDALPGEALVLTWGQGSASVVLPRLREDAG